jgi:UDP-N-acetylglucosamine acyltransferase
VISVAKAHPTAVIAKGACLHDSVEVGPYAVIGPKVKIGAGTRIAGHVVIDGNTTIGERCEIFTGACLGATAQYKQTQEVSALLSIGNDNVIREYVTVSLGSREGSATLIGNKNFIMAGVHIGHDCRLGNEIVIANYTAIAGHVVVEDNAVMSGLVGLHQFVHVGRLAMIGGFSKVVMDVPPFSLCDGNPARFFGPNLVGLRRSGFSNEKIARVKKVLKILFASGNSMKDVTTQLETEFKGDSVADEILSFIRGSKRGITRRTILEEKFEVDPIS